MQETEAIVEARPRRPARVIPPEPYLRQKYYQIVSSTGLFCVFLLNIHFAFNTLIWNYSLFNFSAISYFSLSIVSLFTLAPWRSLEKHRQQTARYNLVVNLGERVDVQPEPGIPALPDEFVLAAQRRWLATWLSAGVSCFFLYLLGTIVYTGWQITWQAVRQGVPLVAVAGNTVANVVIVLLGTALVGYALIVAPRVSLTATRDGLTCRRGFRVVTIPWQQARLFAVIYQVNRSKREPLVYYELASQDVLIRWPSVALAARIGTPAGTASFNSLLAKPASGGAFPDQVQLLNSIVAERTGLPLYDLHR